MGTYSSLIAPIQNLGNRPDNRAVDFWSETNGTSAERLRDEFLVSSGQRNFPWIYGTSVCYYCTDANSGQLANGEWRMKF